MPAIRLCKLKKCVDLKHTTVHVQDIPNSPPYFLISLIQVNNGKLTCIQVSSGKFS